MNNNKFVKWVEKPKKPYYKRPMYQLPTDLLGGNTTYSKSKDLHNYYNDIYYTDLSKTYEDFVNTLKENIKTQGFQDFKFVLPDILGSYIVIRGFNLRKRIQTEYMEKSEFLEFIKNILCIDLYSNLPVLMLMVNSKKKESNIRFSVDYSHDSEYSIIEVPVFDEKKLYDYNELYQLLKINMIFNLNRIDENKSKYNNLVTNVKDYVYTHFFLYYLYSKEYYDKYYEFFKSIVQDQLAKKLLKEKQDEQQVETDYSSSASEEDSLFARKKRKKTTSEKQIIPSVLLDEKPIVIDETNDSSDKTPKVLIESSNHLPIKTKTTLTFAKKKLIPTK
ncbi:hypothetical protein ABK040_013050 [Willaertia magna]